MATAVASLPARAALVPSTCPFDIADVDANGGHLVRVVGPDTLTRRGYTYPGWCGEYTVPRDLRLCPFCNKEIGDKRCIAIMPDGEWRWADAFCAVAANGGQSMMNPRKRVKRDCARCGLPFDDHGVSSESGVTCEDGWHYVEKPEEIAA